MHLLPSAALRRPSDAGASAAFLLIGLLAACGSDSGDLVQELVEASGTARDAHLAGDAEALAATWADTLRLVADGRVERGAPETLIPRFRTYFDATRFLEWDDIDPPDVSVSDDAGGPAMGRVVVTKRVRTVTTDTLGFPRYGHDVFAWMETWRREAVEGTEGTEGVDGGEGDAWRMEALASTERPGREEELLARLGPDTAFDGTVPADAGGPALDDRMVGGAIRAAALRALGGAEAVRGVESVLAVAVGDGPGGRYTQEVFAHVDGRARLEERRRSGDGAVESRTVLLRTRAGDYLRSGPDGELVPADSAVATVLLGHQFPLLVLAPHALLGSAVDVRAGDLRGRPVLYLAHRDPAGRSVELAHARDGGLPVGGRLEPGAGAPPVVFEYGDWRFEGAVRLPGSVRVVQGDEAFLLRYPTLVVDPGADPEPPSP